MILVTRPLPAAEETAARLRDMGYVPLLAPMLCIEPLAAELPAVPPRAVLVTSRNALAGLPAGWRGVALFAVGDATAAHAVGLGFTRVESAAADAAALAALCRARLPIDGGPVLLASGTGQGAVLAADLRAAGYEVLHRELYRAHPATRLPAAATGAWNGAALYAALFFSAETAAAFVRLVAHVPAPARGVTALAIGGPAAAALAPLPWQAVRVALAPTQEAMLAMLR